MTEDEIQPVVLEQQGVQNDEVAELTAEQMIENLKSDVSVYEKSLVKAEADKVNYEEQFAVDKQIYDIILQPGALKMLDPVYAYQANPEFQKLQEIKQKFKIKQDLAIGEGQLMQYDLQIAGIKDALQAAKEKLARFSKD